MTLMYEPGLEILKMYLNGKDELSRSRILKVRALQIDRYDQMPRIPVV